MMRIVVVSKKPVLIPSGRLPAGIPVDVNEHLGRFLIGRGDAVLYETKLAQDRPCSAAGQMELSFALPAAQASEQTTLSESGVGEQPKRPRGRPRKVAA